MISSENQKEAYKKQWADRGSNEDIADDREKSTPTQMEEHNAKLAPDEVRGS